MLATAEVTLRDSGHSLIVSDLYRERFSPVPDRDEFTERADVEHFDLMREQAHANSVGILAPDVDREQERIRWADVLLFQFPFWWWSFPAILKGWVDRVLSNGFAYGSQNLSGKSAMLALTAETKSSRFTSDADYPILESIERGVLKYCGLNVMPRFVAAEILSMTDEERREILSAFALHLDRHL